MKTNELRELATKAIDHWDYEPQIYKTMEECLELMVALDKSMRPSDDPEAVIHNILEEIADVTIMLEQMRYIFDGYNEFDDILKSKMEKLSSYLSKQETDE